MIVDIIPEKRFGAEKDFYSYLLPKKFENNVKTGSIVEIPFGKENLRGVVLRVHTNSNLNIKYELKEILSVNPDFNIPIPYLKVVEWMAQYYLCSIGEAISLFLPPELSRPRNKDVKDRIDSPEYHIELTTDQKEIFNQLKKSLKNPQKPALLHGVTGSGKTEIYIKLTEEALKLKKQVLLLVPEIVLTPQLVERFEQYFPNQTCLIHSSLSKSERFLSYQSFFNNEKQVLIGPRSALFVPSKNLGLIIVDEEQEDAFKQEKNPRYHTGTVAEKIAMNNKALLLFGSATPRIETYYKCHPELTLGRHPELVSGSQENKGMPKQVRHDNTYHLFELKNRYHKMILPTAKVIDLRNEIKSGNYSPISEEMQKELINILKNKKQALLFINRRGAATFVSCRECGKVLLCPNCSIPLVYHIYNSTKNDYLNCHHCNFKTTIPAFCPECKSQKIKFFGTGIEKIEIELKKLFPKARIFRAEAKNLQNKGDYAMLYRKLRNGEIDIVVGTQIVAKGLDLPSVDMVGIISADVGLHLPYYKANEKTFQIITQVSGRSGRKHNVGKTIIQTYWPDSRSLKFAATHDFSGFYQSEIVDRKKHCYPPFCHLVRVIAEDRRQEKSKAEINKIAKLLNDSKLDFIGPAPCFLSKINNKYRYHLIIKAKKLPDENISKIYEKNPYLVWDVDPTDML